MPYPVLAKIWFQTVQKALLRKQAGFEMLSMLCAAISGTKRADGQLHMLRSFAQKPVRQKSFSSFWPAIRALPFTTDAQVGTGQDLEGLAATEKPVYSVSPSCWLSGQPCLY